MQQMQDDQRPDGGNAPRDATLPRGPRKAYRTPQLVSYGSVAELTRTGSATGSDWLGLFGGW